MTRLMLSPGLSALISGPATAATLFLATASATISNVRAPGLTVTHVGVLGAGAAASGSPGTSASANPGGAAFDASTPPAFVPATPLTFGVAVTGVTPSNPGADSAASAFYERSVTVTFANTSGDRVRATFDTTLARFARASSDGLAGETAFARAIVSVARNGVVQSIVGVTQERLGGQTGTVELPFNEGPVTTAFDVSAFTTETVTYTLRVEGNAATSAAGLTPVPLPATAPLLAAALLGAGAVLRRRRGA